jgi:thiol-disulfide isomerase/thioredoxin
MKPTRTLLLALLCTGLSTQAQVYISGQISSPKSNSIQFTAEFQEDTEQPFIAQVDKSGQFRTTIPLETASYFELQHHDEVTTLFLEPGDSLNIQMSTKKFDESLKYTGRGAANNTYLAVEFLEFGDYDNGKQPYFLQIQTLPSKYELMEAKSLALAAMQKEKELLNKFKNELSPSFYQYRSLEIEYTWKNVLMGMPTFKAYYAERKGESFLKSSIPKAYYDFIDTAQLENLQALKIGHYHEFIEEVIYFKAEENMAFTDNSTLYFQNVVNTAEQLLGPGLTRSTFILEMIDELGYELDPAVFQPYLSEYATSKDASVAQRANTLREKFERMAKGVVLPPLFAFDTKGNQVALNSLVGKVVYLDLWASWCMPCIQEFPKSKILQETYAANPDVVFVYLSLDEEEDAWKKALKKHKLDGYNLFLPGFKQALPQYFSVNSIPRYILIGKKGEIIHASAPRPGSDKIRELINQALETK